MQMVFYMALCRDHPSRHDNFGLVIIAGNTPSAPLFHEIQSPISNNLNIIRSLTVTRNHDNQRNSVENINIGSAVADL